VRSRIGARFSVTAPDYAFITLLSRPEAPQHLQVAPETP
jgi:hypothetical protein